MATYWKATDRACLILNVSSDWYWTDAYPNKPEGLQVEFMFFLPVYPGEHLIVENGTIDSARFVFPYWDNPPLGGLYMQYYHGKTLKPIINYDLSILSAWSSISIVLS